MRLLVCGSRTYSDKESLYKVLDEVLRVHPFLTLIEGGAKGADALAKQWAEENYLPIETFKAEWDKYGGRAGPIRNNRMLKEGHPQMVIAFTDKPIKQSKGTWNMVSIARKAKIPTFTYTPRKLPGRLREIESISPLPLDPEVKKEREMASSGYGGWWTPEMAELYAEQQAQMELGFI